jgi:hypothetical protein
MFLEVYAIPSRDWKKENEDIAQDHNLRLVELTGARIRPYTGDLRRAEIVLIDGANLVCAVSYEDLVNRLNAGLESGLGIARINRPDSV